MPAKVLTVRLDEIKENPVALRGVNKQSEEYLGLVDSIRTKGLLNAIVVREKTVQNQDGTEESYYELIDGLHRFSAVMDAGFTEVNVSVIEADDADSLEVQIAANIHKVETKPADYTKQLIRILSLNPLMTEAELASKLCKSAQWISARLSLQKIANPEITALINEGTIKLANAYALARLPAEEMADYVERAIDLGPEEFMPLVTARVKEIKDAKRKGLDAAPKEFIPVAFMQKMKEVKEEQLTGEIAKILCSDLDSPEAGFNMAVSWMLHLDPKSVEIQKAKDDEHRAKRTKIKEERAAKAAVKKAEKKKKEAEAAAKAADEAQLKLSIEQDNA